MKESFTSIRGTSVDDRLRRLRGMLFVATLTATVLALGGAAAIRIAAPASRTDLPLIFVACVLEPDKQPFRHSVCAGRAGTVSCSSGGVPC